MTRHPERPKQQLDRHDSSRVGASEQDAIRTLLTLALILGALLVPMTAAMAGATPIAILSTTSTATLSSVSVLND